MTSRIVLIVVYFGKWPAWFDAFLVSCKANESVDWLFFTDCQKPPHAPANVRFISSSMMEFKEIASAKTKLDIPLINFRKLCDLKPAYGHISEEYITDYEFWGFCDVDIIWGNIRKFVTHELLNKYDVITALENNIAGHFTIIRNTAKGRLLYQHNHRFQEHFMIPKYQWFDEQVFTEIIHELRNRNEINVCWNKEILKAGLESPAHQDYYLDRWMFDQGAVYSMTPQGEKVKEYMYLHFISWKSYMKSPALVDINRFYISYNGININPFGTSAKFFNAIRRTFWGFQQRKAFNLWLRSFKKGWALRKERWRLKAGRR